MLCDELTKQWRSYKMNIAIMILTEDLNKQRSLLKVCLDEIAVTADYSIAEAYAPLIAKTHDAIKDLEQAIKILNYELNS